MDATVTFTFPNQKKHCKLSFEFKRNFREIESNIWWCPRTCIFYKSQSHIRNLVRMLALVSWHKKNLFKVPAFFKAPEIRPPTKRNIFLLITSPNLKIGPETESNDFYVFYFIKTFFQFKLSKIIYITGNLIARKSNRLKNRNFTYNN